MVERSPNYYETLGLEPSASLVDIKKAYRRLARQYHPDINPDDPAAVEKFQHITQIYRILADPETREDYDQQLLNRLGTEDEDAVYSVRSKASPTSATLLYQEGIEQAQAGRYEQAIARYTDALALNPDFAEAYSQRGFAHHRLNQDSEAFADYAQALERSPKLADAYYYRGLTRFKLGYSESAISDYSKAIHQQPNHAQAYFHRGLAYADLGEQGMALDDLQQAIRWFQQRGDRTGASEAKALRKRLLRSRSGLGIARPLARLGRDTWMTLRLALFNPISGPSYALARLSPKRAIATGLAFTAVFNLCFILGIPQLWQRYAHLEALPVEWLFILGWLPFLGLVCTSALMRLIFGGIGNWSSDSFMAGLVMIPLSAIALFVSPASLALALGLSAGFVSYTALLLYGSCSEIWQLSDGKAALAATLMTPISLLPFIILVLN